MANKKYHSTFIMELDGELKLPNTSGGYTSKEMFILGGLHADAVAKEIGLNKAFYNSSQKFWFVSKSKAKKAYKLGVSGPLPNPSNYDKHPKVDAEDILEYNEEKKSKKENENE